MAVASIACWGIGIAGLVLGANIGFLTLAIVKADKPIKSKWRSPLPKVEAALAWAQVRAPYDLIEEAVSEYSSAFDREMFVAAKQEHQEDGATWSIPIYAWRNAL